nr:conserved hypothetical protein [Melanopsichium pennsylvanicum 4]
MPLPRYSLDNDAEGSDEEFEESYTSNDAASSSRLPSISTIPLGAGSPAPPSVSRRSLSPSISTYDAPSSLDTDALLASTADPTTSATCSKSRIPPTAIGWPYSSASPINALSAFEQLTLYMSTQKAAPEVLPFPTGSFELLVSQMEQQQSILDSLLHVSSTTQNPEAVEDEYGEAGKGGIDEDEFLRLNLVQVDLERCKWLLKQILRSRIDLLHKYAGFIAVRQMEKRKLNATEERFVNE